MNRTIYILLRGGLGNQLHQIAAAVKLSDPCLSSSKRDLIPKLICYGLAFAIKIDSSLHEVNASLCSIVTEVFGIPIESVEGKSHKDRRIK